MRSALPSQCHHNGQPLRLSFFNLSAPPPFHEPLAAQCLLKRLPKQPISDEEEKEENARFQVLLPN